MSRRLITVTENFLVLGLMCVLAVGLFPRRLLAQADDQSIDFIGVTPDNEYEQADSALARYLSEATGMTLRRMRVADYHAAISEVVQRLDTDRPYVARLTPYAFVVSEIEGARFETLATYKSKATGGLTYYSYLVVKADRPDFKFSSTPTLREVDEFLTSKRRLFAYHDKFSTSSYFIPLLYFRSHRIFDTDPGQRAGEDFHPITVEQTAPGTGSSDLVRMVEAGKIDIAAVWDGTKTKFDHSEKYKDLRFIRIDTPLPNDLLVCSRNLSRQRKEALLKAVEDMPCAHGKQMFAGDFVCWTEFKKAFSARHALGALRRAAVEQPAPVTVSIAEAQGSHSPGQERLYEHYLEDARQAVRLAGTELVLYDEDYHKWDDLDWTLRIIHDGAVRLTSRVHGKFVVDGRNLVPSQVFRISFTDDSDLTRRIVTIIHTRLDRIRYVWPFENMAPTIIRDVGFTIPVGTPVAVQRITWIDPEENEFAAGNIFSSKVQVADFHKFQLDGGGFPKLPDAELDLNPMSNSAYRVVLVPPDHETFLFHMLTVSLVVLCVMTAGGVAFDYRRHLRRKNLHPKQGDVLDGE